MAKKRRRKTRKESGGYSRAAGPRSLTVAEATGTPFHGRRLALLLALLAFLVYNANFRLIGAGDSYPARFLPFALWNHGTLYLDPVREATAQQHPKPYWIQTSPDGHSVSLYPIVAPLLASPLYLPAALWARWAGETYERLTWLGNMMEKLSASLIAAAAV